MVVDDVKKRMDDTNSITELISEKIIARTSALVEAKKKECEDIIVSIQAESTEATNKLDNAVQKLMILHEGNKEKSALLEGQYHEALGNITRINAKLEALGTELQSKMKTIESGFLRLFETEEEAKHKQKQFQVSLTEDRRKINFIITKVFGSPFDDDETNKGSLLHRLVVMEKGSKARDDRLRALTAKQEALEKEIKLLKEQLEEVKHKSVAQFVVRLLRPFKKLRDEVVLAIIKSLVIKLLLALAIVLGVASVAQDYKFFDLFIDDLF